MESFPHDIEGKLKHLAGKSAQLQSGIQKAQALEQSRQIDKAISEYLACLNMASQENFPIMDGQLVEIWMGIGFCYANRNDWRQALEWYHRAEAALLSTPEFNPDPKSPQAQQNAKNWTPYLPQGVQVIFSKQYNAKEHLADVSECVNRNETTFLGI